MKEIELNAIGVKQVVVLFLHSPSRQRRHRRCRRRRRRVRHHCLTLWIRSSNKYLVPAQFRSKSKDKISIIYIRAK